MRTLFLGLLAALPLAFTVGCSGSKPTVVVDERSEAEKQQELADYDKQMAADAANYEKQN